MNNAYLQAFKAHGSSEDGFLSAIEKSTGLPFDIERVYTVVRTNEGNVRGYHAHKKLEQVVFAIHGEIDVHCEDLDGNAEDFHLDDPHVGLYIGPLVWHTLTYHEDAILMVLASDIFSEADYIRDYADFKKLGEKHGSKE